MSRAFAGFRSSLDRASSIIQPVWKVHICRAEAMNKIYRQLDKEIEKSIMIPKSRRRKEQSTHSQRKEQQKYMEQVYSILKDIHATVCFFGFPSFLISPEIKLTEKVFTFQPLLLQLIFHDNKTKLGESNETHCDICIICELYFVSVTGICLPVGMFVSMFCCSYMRVEVSILGLAGFFQQQYTEVSKNTRVTQKTAV